MGYLNLIFLMLCIAAAHAAMPPRSEAIKQFIVHYNSTSKLDILHHVNHHANVSVEDHLEDLNLLVVRGHKDRAFSLQDHPAVHLVEEDPVREWASTCCAFRNSPIAPLSKEVLPWGLFATQAADAYFKRYTPGTTINRQVIICLMDTGFNVQTVDLKGNRVTGCSGKDCPYLWNRDRGGHGTSVASIMASVQNGQGIAGVIPQGAEIYVVRLSGNMAAEGPFASNLVKGFRQCEAYRAKRQVATKRPQRLVIQTAIAGEMPTTAEAAYLTQLFDSGNVVVVGAAGNRPKSVLYPAAYKSVLSVGAVGCDLTRAPFSTMNDALDLVAPGVQVFASSAADTAISRQEIMTGVLKVAKLTNTKWATRGIGGVSVGGVTAVSALCSWHGSFTAKARCKNMKGKICLVRYQRSTCEAVRLCQLSGARAAVVLMPYINGKPTSCNPPQLKMNDENGRKYKCFNPKTKYIPSISLSALDSARLLTLMKKPPVMILSTDVVKTPFTNMDGTSFSAPYVSGIAARLWAKYPACSAAYIRSALLSSAKDLGKKGYDPEYGHGLVQAKNALLWLMKRTCAKPKGKGKGK